MELPKPSSNHRFFPGKSKTNATSVSTWGYSTTALTCKWTTSTLSLIHIFKLSIIEELKELVESGDDANKSYTEFKKLQQQWNETKLVPQGKVNELWKNYQLYVEKFYDLLKLNNEFREYDFKKNLEIKTHLCEAAEKDVYKRQQIRFIF